MVRAVLRSHLYIVHGSDVDRSEDVDLSSVPSYPVPVTQDMILADFGLFP